MKVFATIITGTTWAIYNLHTGELLEKSGDRRKEVTYKVDFDFDWPWSADRKYQDSIHQVSNEERAKRFQERWPNEFEDPNAYTPPAPSALGF